MNTKVSRTLKVRRELWDYAKIKAIEDQIAGGASEYVSRLIEKDMSDRVEDEPYDQEKDDSFIDGDVI